MNILSTIARGASAVMLVAVVSAICGCHEASHHVLNPDWNTIPPGPSPVIEEMRPASGVTAVVLDGVGQLFVRQGGMESLRIRTEERIMPFIRTEQSGGRLVVGFEQGTSFNGQASTIEFHLTVTSLASLELDGAGGIHASDISTDRLSLSHSGAGSIDVSGLDANRLDVSRSGVGDLDVAGSVQQQSIVLGGLGNYDARNLESVEAQVTILASGSATVRVSDRLDARIEGGGSVYYLGNPVVQRTGNGWGSVQPM